VLCGTETSSGGWCSVDSMVRPGQNRSDVQPGDGVVPVPLPAQPVPLIDGTTGGGVLVPNVGAKGGFVNGGQAVVAPDVVPFGVARDTFWPKSVATWLILSVVFILASVQFVSPTRRWRLRRGRRTETSAV